MWVVPVVPFPETEDKFFLRVAWNRSEKLGEGFQLRILRSESVEDRLRGFVESRLAQISKSRFQETLKLPIPVGMRFPKQLFLFPKVFQIGSVMFPFMQLADPLFAGVLQSLSSLGDSGRP